MMFAVAYFRTTPANEPEMRLEVTTPATSNLGLAISPDGRSLVFEVASQGKSQLWMRPLDSATARPLAGTDSAVFPFWSPNSRALGFFADRKLKRIDVEGGPAQTVADAPNPRGGAWGTDGTIIFNPVSSGPLYRISSTGGVPTAVTRLEHDQGSHRYPQFLPDGRHFVYLSLGKPEASGVYVGSLDGFDSKRLLTSDSQAAYVSPGYLLFLRQGTLLAQRFDARRLELLGESFPLAEQVAVITGYTGSAAVSAAANGTVAYRTNAGTDSRLVWFDRSGKEISSLGPVGRWSSVQLSSDAKRVVGQRSVDGNVDLWLIEVARGLATRLTTDPADDEWPVWSPDGRQIAFDSNRKGSFDLYLTIPSGSEAEKPLMESSQTKAPLSWSSDGRYLLYALTDARTGVDLWALPLFGDRKAFPVINRNFDQINGEFSPDTRWIAYDSNESGRTEIYIEPFPPSGEKWQISLEGGGDPRWTAKGRELFYIAPDGSLMTAPILVSVDGKRLEPASPKPLFRTQLIAGGGINHQYAVVPDGDRLLVTVPVESTPSPIAILINWAKP